MSVQPLNMKMLKGNMLQPLLQQMFKMASLSMGTRWESSSSFISHLIKNYLLYTGGDHTHTLLQVFFQVFNNHSYWSASILLLQILSPTY